MKMRVHETIMKDKEWTLSLGLYKQILKERKIPLILKNSSLLDTPAEHMRIAPIIQHRSPSLPRHRLFPFISACPLTGDCHLLLVTYCSSLPVPSLVTVTYCPVSCLIPR